MSGNDGTLASLGVPQTDAQTLLRNLAITSLHKSCAILYTFAAAARDVTVAQPEHAQPAHAALPIPMSMHVMPSLAPPTSLPLHTQPLTAQPSPSLPSLAQHAQPPLAQPTPSLPTHARHALARHAPATPARLVLHQPPQLAHTSLPHSPGAASITSPASVPAMTNVPHALQPPSSAGMSQPARKRPRPHAAHTPPPTAAHCPHASDSPPRQRRRLSHRSNASSTAPATTSIRTRNSVTANLMEIGSRATSSRPQMTHNASNLPAPLPSASSHAANDAPASHCASLPARKNFDPGG